MNEHVPIVIVLIGIAIVFGVIMVFGIHYTWQDKPVQINPIVPDDVPYDRWK